MITLVRWPFRRIDGIEIAPRLIEIAQRNLRRLGCVKGTITLCDAAEFTSLNPYNMFYMFLARHQLIRGSAVDPNGTRTPRVAPLCAGTQSGFVDGTAFRVSPVKGQHPRLLVRVCVHRSCTQHPDEYASADFTVIGSAE